MVALERVMDDLEGRLLRVCRANCSRKRAQNDLVAESADPRTNRYVCGQTCVVSGPGDVPHASTGSTRFAPRPASSSAVASRCPHVDLRTGGDDTS